MKVVALVSGGKDSCYNMVMCERYGHEVVALGNLLPEAAETDDLDSYMYQTVGHQVIAAYAACCGLPLFRRRIRGGSRQQQLVYEDTEGDEVEDLFCLLAFVKERMPEVQAVASGAIASDYQRTRVERVCARLGLVSLAFLWQQPQAPLLQRMIDSQIEAILVKIAAAGLTPARHLGAPLAALPHQLAKLRRVYGCNVCGEGGEYESLTLDCPLFRRGRIVLDAWEAVVVSQDSLAPVALLHPTAFHVEPKGPAAGQGRQQQHEDKMQQQGEQQQPPAAGAGEGGNSLEGGEVVQVPLDYAPLLSATPTAAPAAEAAAETTGGAGPAPRLSITAGGEFASITAEVPRGPSPAAESGPTTAAALAAALGELASAMHTLGLSWHSTLFVHLYVPSMAHFAAANEAYARFFPPVNPPARATVEIGPNPELALVVEVLFARRAKGRRVLHVQSISEWAPSCIGPYAQSLTHQGLVLMAGQIPLDPPTMAMVEGGLDAQCLRALRSCQAVAVAQRTDLPRAMLWCTVYCSGAAGAAGAQRAEHHLTLFLGGELGGQEQPGQGSESSPESDAESGGESDLELDEYLLPPPMERHWQTLVTYAVMPELPRGALVEVQPVACVVDDTLDPSSSSDSSDEGGEGQQQQQRGQGAPAAARGRAGSMSGWIGWLEGREDSRALGLAAGVGQGQGGSGAAADVDAAGAAAALEALQVEGEGGGADLVLRCRQLSSQGRLCRAHVTLAPAAGPPSAAALPAAAAAAAAALPLGQLPGALAPWQQAVADALLGALVHAELALADVASLKVYCPGEGSVQAGVALRGALQSALGEGVQATVVPVLAVGSDAGLGAALLVELLAVHGPC